MAVPGIIGDAEPEDAFDPTGVMDYAAVNRILNKRSRRILQVAGGGEDNERALALARVVILAVVGRAVRRIHAFLEEVEAEFAASDEYIAETAEQRALGQWLFALTYLQLVREGTLDPDPEFLPD